MSRALRSLIAFGTGWWLASTVAAVAMGVLIAAEPTTGIPAFEVPLLFALATLVPGVVPVTLAWQFGIGTGLIRLPAECGNSVEGACHGIGWGIAAEGLVAGLVLLVVAWLCLPVGIYLDARGRSRGPGWPVSVGAVLPHVGGVAGLIYLVRLSRAAGHDERRARWRAVRDAVGAYLLVAVAVFVLALAGAMGVRWS